ncbi:hypothetical protein Ocin01_17788 [Orchesella cincta]|uniref:Uncharacterized protein n=1 Tax=Orchesella cincta TaxID=48709 RepID=A0A1D2M7C2_ORCCI|nr:hypothetical protein Ocin01_17788 [Orchesella cincta]
MLFLAQLIIPSILLASAVSISRSFLDTPDSPPALKVTLDSYNNLVTLASSTDPAISSDQFSSVIGSSYKPVPDSILLSRELLNVGRSSLADYREKYSGI